MGPEVQRRLFNVSEYYRLAEAGILGEDDRVELIDGEIVEMSPIGSLHAAIVDRVDFLVQRVFAGRAIVRVQGPIRLNEYSEPQPDVSILKTRTDFYAAAHPAPADVLLVVEVADASLAYDRHVKLTVYSRAGIAEVWLVDLVSGLVEVFTEPTSHGYQISAQFGRGERLKSTALDHEVLIDEILGPG